MTDTNKELRPCPFCDGKPELKHTGGQRQEWWVQCSKCYSEIGCLHPKQQAIDVWNGKLKEQG